MKTTIPAALLARTNRFDDWRANRQSLPEPMPDELPPRRPGNQPAMTLFTGASEARGLRPERATKKPGATRPARPPVRSKPAAAF